MKNRIEKLEITIEAHDDGLIIKDKDKEIASLESSYAILENQKDELERSMMDLQEKYEDTLEQKKDLSSKTSELETERTEHSETRRKLEVKEKLQAASKAKIDQLLDEN